MNYANQAMVRTRALQARGHDARHVLYDWGSGIRYGFDYDQVAEMNRQTWLTVQLSVLGDALRHGYEIYELRNRTLVYPPGEHGFFTGFDLPYLKGSGAKVVYGFTGYDLRRKSSEMARNPYSPWHYGLALRSDEDQQLRYLDYLRQWVDCFVVTDPEMQFYIPEAEIVPRALDLARFDFVGVESRRRPLVVHAPSDRIMKGTDHLLQAVDELRSEGLQFEFKLIEQMDHSEAAEWYRRADVIVDQLRIGWYGVAAVEGMALGKPVVAYLLDSARARLEPEVPIVNANPDTIKATLANLVGDAELRRELADRGRAYVEAVHDIEQVVLKLESLYRRVLAQPPTEPVARPPEFALGLSSGALEEMTDALRYKNLREKQLPELVRKARLYDELTTQPGGESLTAPEAVEEDAAVAEEAPPVRAGVGVEAESGRGLQICILSRKKLSRITRIVRQARALLDAGHDVVVVCREKPVDELVATVPEVEWLELEVEPWTRSYALRKREGLRARRLRRKQRLAQASELMRPLLSFAYAVRDRVGDALRIVFLSLPASLLLPNDDPWKTRLREFRGHDTPRLLALLVQPLAQRGNSVSFAEETSAALAGRTFDIVQAHDNYSLLAARRLARESGAQLVYDAVEISEHRVITAAKGRGLIVRYAEWRERREEAKIIKKDVAGTLTIGDGLADWYERRYRIPRPTVVRNCRHYWRYERRLDIRRDCGVTADDNLVVWFGYAYPEQGLEAIVEAARFTPPNLHFALLVDTIPRWETFYERVRARAEELGVARNMHFLPARDPNDLISYVSGADLGIIPRPNVGPNVYFSMPNKFMEMVMARLPIVVSDLADMRELITRFEIGTVCDVGDPEDVAAALARVADSLDRNRLRTALERAARELSWENEAQRYLELVDSVAAASPRSAARLRPGGSASSSVSAPISAAPTSEPAPAVDLASSVQLASSPLIASAQRFLLAGVETGSEPADPATAAVIARMLRLLSSQVVERTEDKMRVLDFRGAQRVLVAGAGDGVWPLVLGEGNERVDALEHRPAQLDVAIRLVEAIGKQDRIVFKRGQVVEADYPQGSFDLICCDRTVMHQDHELAFANLAGWLAPEGRLYLSYASIGTRLQLIASSFVRGDLRRADAELRIVLSDAAFRCGLGRIPRCQGRALLPEELLGIGSVFGLEAVESPGVHGGREEFHGFPGTVDFVLAKGSKGWDARGDGRSAPIDELNRLLAAGLPHLVLRELARLDPDLRQEGAYSLLVRAAVKAGEVSAVVDEPGRDPLTRGVEDPFLLGLWLQSRGAHAEAVDLLRQVVDAQADAAFLLGLCHLALRDFPSAREAFDLDLARDPDQLRGRAGFALATLAMDEPGEAFRLFESFIEELAQVRSPAATR